MAPEGEAGELAVDARHHDPGFGARVGDAQAEGGQMGVEILDLTDCRWLAAVDRKGGQAGFGHGV